MPVFRTFNLKICDLIKAVDNGKYQLPCFQRDFKWNPSRIKSLMNSIQHEYPAGSLLFLRVADSDNPLIPFQGFKYSSSEGFTERAEMLVLDGQQRMTSCYAVFSNLGYYTYFIDFVKLMQKAAEGEDVDFENLIVHKRHRTNPFVEIPNGLFPMAYLKDRNTMRNQIRQYVEEVSGDPTKRDICNFLNYDFGQYVDSIMDYEFPVIELPASSSMESVCKVFQTINTSGLKLSVFDICVAVFMPQHINLKEKVATSSDEKQYVKYLLEKDPTSALQVIALLANRSPNANKLPENLFATDILNYWNDAIDSIEDTLILFDSFGAGTRKDLSILPYTPMVTIVAAVLRRNHYSDMDVPTKAVVENRIKKYFYTAALSTRYTEGTNAKIKDDFDSLNMWISNNIEPSMITHGVEWNTTRLINNKKDGAFGRAVLCLLNNQNPKDFYTQNRDVGVGENIETCDLHHIFPKAKYKDAYPDIIDSVFNFTWLIKQTNVYIQDDTTHDYLLHLREQLDISEDQLKTILCDHLISNDSYNAMAEQDYNAFLSNRAESVKQRFIDSGVNVIDVDADQVEVEEDTEDEENL